MNLAAAEEMRQRLLAVVANVNDYAATQVAARLREMETEWARSWSRVVDPSAEDCFTALGQCVYSVLIEWLGHRMPTKENPVRFWESERATWLWRLDFVRVWSGRDLLEEGLVAVSDRVVLLEQMQALETEPFFAGWKVNIRPGDLRELIAERSGSNSRRYIGCITKPGEWRAPCPHIEIYADEEGKVIFEPLLHEATGMELAQRAMEHFNIAVDMAGRLMCMDFERLPLAQPRLA